MRPIRGETVWGLTDLEAGLLGPCVDLLCGLAALLGLIALLGPRASVDGFGWLLVNAHLVCLLAVLPGVFGRWWRRKRLLPGW